MSTVCVLDSFGGMLNPDGEMPKTHYKTEFVWFYWKKIMVVMLFNGKQL